VCISKKQIDSQSIDVNRNNKKTSTSKMQYQIHTKTAEEYLNEFPEQPEVVGKIIGLPTFTTVYKVVVAL